MSTAQIINELEKLPDTERTEVLDWLIEHDDEAFFAWADKQAIDRTMTEEEILSLPRLRPSIRREGAA